MNPKFTICAAVTAAALATTTALPVAAQEAGTWSLGVGFHQVNPKSDNGRVAGMDASVGSSARPTFTVEYFLRDNLGLELLAALPFKHSVSLNGTKVGTVRQLPPVVSLQYHFANTSKFTPFLGLGVNFTTFFDEDSPLGDLKMKNSWGLAAHAGVDYAVTETTAVRLDVRWADIDTEVRLDGAKIGTAEIDPLVYGVSYVWRF